MTACGLAGNILDEATNALGNNFHEATRQGVSLDSSPGDAALANDRCFSCCAEFTVSYAIGKLH